MKKISLVLLALIISVALLGAEEKDQFIPLYIEALPTNLMGTNNVDAIVALGLLSSGVEDISGAQGAPISATTGGTLFGFQGAGLITHAQGEVYGMQAAGAIANAQKDIYGAQAAGVICFAGQDMQGAQFSGVLNVVNGDLSGFQYAGILNMVMGEYTYGFQASGVANSAHKIAGGQGGIYNRADYVRGVQIGLVNKTGRIQGSQIGLVNINNRQQGFNLGLINISKDGLFHGTYWGDQKGRSFFGLQQGPKPLYTLAYAGFLTDDIQQNGDSLLFGLGIGVHHDMDGLFLEADISAQTLPMEEWEWCSQEGYYNLTERDVHPVGRIAGGIYLGKRLVLYGGTSWDILLEGTTKEGTFADRSYDSFSLSGNKFRAYPTLFGGIKF